MKYSKTRIKQKIYLNQFNQLSLFGLQSEAIYIVFNKTFKCVNIYYYRGKY